MKRFPACGHHGSPVNAAEVFASRRSFLASSAVGLLGFNIPVPVAAQLLDPTNLPPATGAPANASSSSLPDPSYARGMASSIASALTSLVSAYVGSAQKSAALSKRQRELEQEVRDRRARMSAEMEEYRQGLFCSGCGQTRSQIWAKGEQFPHAGQTIIRPTQDQIDAREKSLVDALDKLIAELDKVVKQKPPHEKDRGRIRQEIFDGGILWRTATGYEEALINGRAADRARQYHKDRERITIRLAEIEKVEAKEEDAFARNALADELMLMVTTLAAIEARRATDLRAQQMALSKATEFVNITANRFSTHVMEQAPKVTEFGERGFLDINGNLLRRDPFHALGTPIGGAGGIQFHMGSYSDETWGSILPSVAKLVERANSPVFGGPGAYYPHADEETSDMRVLASKLRVIIPPPAPPAPAPEPTPENGT